MFADPAFAENRTQRIHRWVPWVAGFSGTFVQDLLDKHSDSLSSESRILDPFAGVGTSLVQGKLNGFEVVGFELNPYAHLVCLAKLEWDLDSSSVRRGLTELLDYTHRIDYSVDARHGMLNQTLDAWDTQLSALNSSRLPPPKIGPPGNFRSRRPFFSPAVQEKVLLLKEHVQRIENETLRRLSLAALGAVLVSISNYSYEPSLSSREAAGKEPIQNVRISEAFGTKIRGMVEDVLWIADKSADKGSHVVHRESCMGRLVERLGHESVDLAITSPPYLNNYHYLRNTRPHLYWLDLVDANGQLGELEQKYFGKFWQTVRSGPRIYLKFELPGLEKRLEEIAAQNQGKRYTGEGWSSYAAVYFNDTYDHMLEMYECLKRGSRYFSVVGNNILQGVHVATQRFVGRISQLVGFELEGIHPLRERVGSSIVGTGLRSGKRQIVKLEDWMVIMRKP